MTRRHIGPRERLAIFAAAGGMCHICGVKIDGTRDRWDIEHVIPLAMGGDEDTGSDNLQPACASCHRGKTATDLGALAKAKRVEAKHLGAKRSRSPIPGSKGTPWKRKLDGTTVPR
jgi:5-methylcytosine-specific restriction endonuclease McrA